jgi:hypothetical protein
MIIDYVLENQSWKYDIAEFVSLTALPDVRAELAKGDLTYIQKTSSFPYLGLPPKLQIIAERESCVIERK